MNIVKAPFTEDQVRIIGELQSRVRYGHPYTCRRRTDSPHQVRNGDTGVLDVSRDGFVCPDCGYVQDWIFESSLDMPLSSDISRLILGMSSDKAA